MIRCHVLSPLKAGGVIHPPGAVIELDEAVLAGIPPEVVQIVGTPRTEAAPSETKAPAAEGSEGAGTSEGTEPAAELAITSKDKGTRRKER